MNRLLVLTVTLYGVILLLSAGIIGYGRNTPTSDSAQAAGFARCGDRACFMGITPGVTGWADARLTLSRMASSYYTNHLILIRNPLSGGVWFYPSINGSAVGRIYIDVSANNFIPASWIVDRYGPPCGVSVYYDIDMAILRYPWLIVNLKPSNNRLAPDTPVTSIQFTDPAIHSRLQPDPCFDNVSGWKTATTEWMGFASLRRYTSLRR
jgi:hypothetical protein